MWVVVIILELLGGFSCHLKTITIGINIAQALFLNLFEECQTPAVMYGCPEPDGSASSLIKILRISRFYSLNLNLSEFIQDFNN